MDELNEKGAARSAEAGHEGPSREALMKGYDAGEADALLELEQKFDARGGGKSSDAVADAITAATVYRNGS